MIEVRVIKIGQGFRRYIPQVRSAGWEEYFTSNHYWYCSTYCPDSKRCFTRLGAMLFLKRRAKEVFGNQVVWKGEIDG